MGNKGNINLGDTIAAISTPLGEGGIGIVRISGPEAFDIGQKIFYPAWRPKKPYPKNRYLYRGYIKNRAGEILDEVLVSFMKGPHTFTREDIVEINGHGGAMVLRMVLGEVLAAGARVAEPGEFTRRAFLSGRIDLSQAENMLKLIRARSEKAIKIAAANIKGILSGEITKLRQQAMEILAHLEAALDFPDELSGDEPVTEQLSEIDTLERGLEKLVKGADRGLMFQEGVATAIVGKPNVGKSSLLNALLGQQRAIVHEIPGTTRDILEGLVPLSGFTIRLIDTAGIHGAEDPVEKIGVERSRAAAGQARLLLVVFDGSSPMTAQDETIVSLKQAGQKTVFVVNKKDLGVREDYKQLEERFPDIPVIYTSALKKQGLDELEEAITRQLELDPVGEEVDPLLVSMRHVELVAAALDCIRKAGAMRAKEPLELISLEVRLAWEKLGEVTGETATDELLDFIFNEFCIGK